MAVVFGRVIAIFSLVLLGFIVNRKKTDESRRYLINCDALTAFAAWQHRQVYEKLSPGL